jgi:uncharacterized metal-binding protein YceD (DUF177 family)
MKWTVMQLRRFVNSSMDFEGTVNLDDYLEKVSDITRMDECLIKGRMQIVDDKYIFDFNIKTNLYMPCAITLEDVLVKIDENVTEIFSDDDEDNEIDGITIDLGNIVWLNILAHKPMRVVKEGAVSPFETKVKKDINPAFKDLKKYLEEV